MKIILKIWLLGAIGALTITQSSSQYLIQRDHYDSDEASHSPSDRRYFRIRSYEPESHAETRLNDPGHYQSLEQYHQPNPGHYSAYQPQHHSPPQQHVYHQLEDSSYPREQEISHHEPRQQYHQSAAPHYEKQNDESYHEPRQQYKQVTHQREEHNQGSYHEPRQQYQQVTDQREEHNRGSYRKPRQQYQQATRQHEDHNQGSYPEPRQQYQQAAPQYEETNKGSYSEPEVKEIASYGHEDSANTQEPSRPHSSHPTPLKTDPKLPLYFTMYEKRVIRDPLDKYGKGPWRYLTYGHGITYGSKEPGKVFEKGYGYIRALGRDHCKLPEHLCPPTDDSKPFDYEGRKEPYFGYRPH